MKKWLLLGGVVVAVIVANVVFWQWSSGDDGNIAIQPLKEWQIFSDAKHIEFKAPNNFERQVSPSGGAYWFDPTENSVSLVYEKFERDESVSAAEQVKKSVAASAACYHLSSVGEFSLFRGCEYLDSVYSFAFGEAEGELFVISINHKYFSEEEVNYIINSIRSKK